MLYFFHKEIEWFLIMNLDSFKVTYFLNVAMQAAVSGLQNQPIINAVIDGDDIIYRDYIDISIAVGTPKVNFSFTNRAIMYYLIYWHLTTFF